MTRIAAIGAVLVAVGCGSSSDTGASGGTEGGTSGSDAESASTSDATPAPAADAATETGSSPTMTDAAAGVDSGLTAGHADAGASTTTDAGPTGPLKTLAVGFSAACVVDAVDRIACWGANPYGELGESPGNVAHLQVLAGAPPASQVVMGNSHTCELTTSGDVYCWGSNLHDQLGHAAGTANDMDCGTAAAPWPCNWVPSKVEGLPTIVAISASAGFDRVCALEQGGTVYCWGETAAQTGPGIASCGMSQADRCVPSPAQVPEVSGLTDLAIGEDHGCGRTSSGLVCWGDDAFLEVSPEQCDGGTCGLVSRADLGALAGPPSLGLNTTCVRKQGGDVACFGRNDYAQLAHAPGTANDAACELGPCNGAATLVPHLAGARAISPTSEWSWCAIASDSTVWCWGSNDTAELGHPAGSQGDTMCGNITCNATPSAVAGVTGAVAVASGHWTSCAIDGSGSLWCWGGTQDAAPARVGP